MDIRVFNHGSVIGIEPVSRAAKDFIEENVSTEGWQWMGPQLIGDHRPMRELVRVMQNQGFVVEG